MITFLTRTSLLISCLALPWVACAENTNVPEINNSTITPTIETTPAGMPSTVVSQPIPPAAGTTSPDSTSPQQPPSPGVASISTPALTATPSAEIPAPIPEGCRPLMIKAMAMDAKAFTAQSQKIELPEQHNLFEHAVSLWSKAVEQCDGQNKSQAQRNLAESLKVHTDIKEQLNSGPQCGNTHKDASALQDMARKSIGERRWNEATMLFHKAENMWNLAMELCTGSQQEIASRRHEESEIDGYNAEYCAPLFDKAREQTQKVRFSATHEEKQETSMIAETLWREAITQCKGNAVQDTARNNAQMLARERGTPWVAKTAPPPQPPQVTKTPTVISTITPPPLLPPTTVPSAHTSIAPAALIQVTPAREPEKIKAASLVTDSKTSPPPTIPAAPVAANTPVVANTPVAAASIPLATLSVPLAATSAALAVPAAPAVPPLSPTSQLAATSLPTKIPSAPSHPPAAKPLSNSTSMVEFIAESPVNLVTYSGIGKVVWANGDVFTGDLLNGQRHGKGLLVWANGMSYRGDWLNDKPMGQGSIKFPNGNQYEGNIKNGLPHGQGHMRFASGDNYSGNFNEGTPEGSGAYTSKGGELYEGTIINGLPDGTGRTKFVSGDIYEGNYHKGEIEGQGSYQWINGDKYVGQWKSGKMHGQGSFIWKSGDKWEGIYENGVQTEQGKITWKQ